ncbi:MAG: M20 family metallo-hydrolase [Candidatus Aminicenantes bacterium]|nr:M20 family metallo-hydrolase [Candidatus Aminicenantes bacterium]
MSFEKIAARLDAYEPEMIELQCRLAAIPAIAPSSGGAGEADKAAFLVEFLKANGITDIQVVKAPDPDAPSGYRPNILASVPGRSADHTVWIMSHMDVVPEGDRTLWRGDPFKPWIEDGKIYGRGVEDNQQDLVASIFAVKAVLDEGLTPAYNVGLALVADEETGSDKGIDYVLAHTDVFKPNDIIIVPDAGNEDGSMIEVAEKSILWLKFKTEGKQTHGSTPEKGKNAFTAASALVCRLKMLYERFAQSEPLFDPPISTFEPTKKDKNVPNINTIPGEDVFYMDCRILPTIPLADVDSAIAGIMADVAAEHDVKIAVEDVQRAPAAPPTSPDAPVAKALAAAVKAVYGIEGKPMGIGGGTVAALFRRAGVPAACWSKLDETLHAPNEYCVIANLVGDAKVFAHVLMQE